MNSDEEWEEPKLLEAQRSRSRAAARYRRKIKGSRNMMGGGGEWGCIYV